MGELIEGWKAAKAAGATRYLGAPCRKNAAHGRARKTNNGGCVKCENGRTRRRERTPGHPQREKYKARNRARKKRKVGTPGHPRREKYKARKRASFRRKRRIPGTDQYAKRMARNRARLARKRSVRGSSHYIAKLLRGRLRHALKGASKSARTLELLGCTIEQLRAHLASQFHSGMAWDNAGSVWHIDHKRPCASFDLTDPAQQRKCFNWHNLQPMLGPENGAKSSWWRGKLWSQGKPDCCSNPPLTGDSLTPWSDGYRPRMDRGARLPCWSRSGRAEHSS